MTDDTNSDETTDRDRETIELTGDAHNQLLGHQEGDETLTETLHRVMLAIPHPVNLPGKMGIDGSYALVRQKVASDPNRRNNVIYRDLPQLIKSAGYTARYTPTNKDDLEALRDDLNEALVEDWSDMDEQEEREFLTDVLSRVNRLVDAEEEELSPDISEEQKEEIREAYNAGDD